MGLIGLLMSCYGGLQGIVSGLTKSTDHLSMDIDIDVDVDIP